MYRGGPCDRVGPPQCTGVVSREWLWQGAAFLAGTTCRVYQEGETRRAGPEEACPFADWVLPCDFDPAGSPNCRPHVISPPGEAETCLSRRQREPPICWPSHSRRIAGPYQSRPISRPSPLLHVQTCPSEVLGEASSQRVRRDFEARDLAALFHNRTGMIRRQSLVCHRRALVDARPLETTKHRPRRDLRRLNPGNDSPHCVGTQRHRFPPSRSGLSSICG